MTETPRPRLSTKTDEPPAEHGLTVYSAQGLYWAGCVCRGWTSQQYDAPMGVQLEFGQHLLTASPVGLS